MRKVIALLGVVAVLGIAGCAAVRDDRVAPNESVEVDYSNIYKTRIDRAFTKFVTKDMPDGSVFVCAITLGPDISEQDCAMTPKIAY